MRFDKDEFIEACRKAVEGDDSHMAVREIVARAVSEPGEVIAGLGEPTHSGITALYRSDKLTILN